MDWGVKAVMVGNGETVGSHNFFSGVRYATAGRPADVASYWPVQKSSITMPCFGGRLVEFSAVRVGTEGQGRDIPPFRLDHNKYNLQSRSDHLLRETLGYCVSNPAVALVTAGPGARVANTGLER